MIRAPERLTAALRRWALATMARRPPDFLIGPAADPYLRRWYVVRTPLGGLYIHHYRHDDDDRALHDHPWASLSLMLQGALLEEHAPAGGDPADRESCRVRAITRRRLVFRAARFAHRLMVPPGAGRPAPLTLFAFGPRIRRWEFHCPSGWRHWKDFVRPGARGEVGRGCGET